MLVLKVKAPGEVLFQPEEELAPCCEPAKEVPDVEIDPNPVDG